jgi:hypothetical protein
MPSSRSHKKECREKKEHRSRSNSRDKKDTKCNSRDHKKHSHSRSRSNDNKQRSKSPSSTSSSEIESFSNEIEIKIKKNKHPDHNKHKSSESCSSSESSSSSSSECKPKFKLCDIYTYFRNRLLEDKQVMVAGSDAYVCAVNNLSQIIPKNHAFTCNLITLEYNIDNHQNTAPYYVREDGVYILFNLLNVDTSCQFTIFVNGEMKGVTTIGTNSGAGQLLSRHMIKLMKNDSVVIRNYISTSSSVKSSLYNGGNLPGNDISLLIMKIAPADAAKVDMCNEHKFMECLSHKKKKLFQKLTDKLVCDNELMVKGFNTLGTFYNRATQVIATEAPVVFNESSYVNGLSWVATNPGQITVLEDGVYKLFFLINTGTAAQFTVFVNGVPINTSTQGTNKGAGQLTTRLLVELKKNDIITVVNHTSANGSVIATELCGGYKQNISTIVTLFKIAPLSKPKIEPVECDLVKHFECYYELFRDYLLYQKCLQITGSPAYLSVSTGTPQNVLIGESFNWSTEIIKHETLYEQGKNNIVIKQTGIYDVFVDISTDQSLQMAVFINNLPYDKAIFGRDSGASRTLLRQFILLKAGDVLSIRNYESHIGAIDTAENPGGEFIGQNCSLMVFLLTHMP